MRNKPKIHYLSEAMTAVQELADINGLFVRDKDGYRITGFNPSTGQFTLEYCDEHGFAIQSFRTSIGSIWNVIFVQKMTNQIKERK